MYNTSKYELYLSAICNSKLRRLQHLHPNKIDFSRNDYLNFSNSKEVVNAAKIAADIYGVGATGSRLLSGNKNIFQELERQIAKDKNSEAALIFNSGFQANISTLASLLDEKILGLKPLVFFDKLNHASLYQGVFLSKAELIRYRHNDMGNLKELLSKYKDTQNPKFIISETLFGMSGDVAPIKELIEFSEKFNAFLYLDEAHATGIFGKQGYGLSTDYNLKNINHVIMGTFSKAIGCSGAYIACSETIKNYLINKNQGFIYSTAPSPMVIGAVSAAWHKIQHLNDDRSKLLSNAQNLRQKINDIGFDTWNSETHIIPIIIKDEQSTLKAQEKLLQDDVIVSAIRPPTVPTGKSCLRIAVTTAHSDDDLNHLICSLQKL